MNVRLPAILALALVISAGTAQAQQDMPMPSRQDWVVDDAGMLSSTERQSLARKLSEYADTTSTQIVVVTMPSLGGVEISQYAIELGRRWGVGQEQFDNGVIIVVSRDDRDVFIATGYGLEGAVPDALAGRIVRHIIIPNFREGRYYAGLSEGINVIIEAAAGEYEGLPARDQDQAPPSAMALSFIILIILFFVINAARSGHGGGGSGRGRRRRRGGMMPPVIIWGGGFGGGSRGGFGGGGGGFGGGGFGGFGGGSFGGGGAGGSW